MNREVDKNPEPLMKERFFSMELDNKVPQDISKRKTIARLLNIPPMLFALVVLENWQLELPAQTAQAGGTGQSRMPRVSLETTKSQNTALPRKWYCSLAALCLIKEGRVQYVEETRDATHSLRTFVPLLRRTN